MSTGNKFAKIPVASHGLHKHSYNYPFLTSINFGDVMPCYYNPLRKGEKDSPRAGLFSQLMPIAHNAFATGRYNFKSIFVPYKLVWRPWYCFDQQTEFYSNGSAFVPDHFPYISNGTFQNALLTTYFDATGTSTNYDVELYSPATMTRTYYLASDDGRRVLRVLGALGCMPSFVDGDKTPINILALLCYIKAYADYYFPNNYVGNSYYKLLAKFFDTDTINFDSLAGNLVQAINVCTLNFYENSVFDLAWDNPVTPNVNSAIPNINLVDKTDPDGDVGDNIVSNQDVSSNTPAVVDLSGRLSGFTEYILQVLKSVSMWTKRHQIAGAKVLDRFLASRGIELSDDSARMSYYLGQRNVEIQVSGVENNTDTNLGELAGRGVASSGDSPLSFECKCQDDGILFVIVSAIPDSNFPVLLDGFATRRDFYDNYNSEFDKLGASPVPSRVVQSTLNGFINYNIQGVNADNVFGFLNQYWDEVQEKPRLLGDFILKSKGAEELSAYHTFRLLGVGSTSRVHSYDFIRMSDSSQYQRLFYSESQENLMLFLRWYGKSYKEKLPLGQSYDWDDDELNRKVNIVVGGSQK